MSLTPFFQNRLVEPLHLRPFFPVNVCLGFIKFHGYFTQNFLIVGLGSFTISKIWECLEFQLLAAILPQKCVFARRAYVHNRFCQKDVSASNILPFGKNSVTYALSQNWFQFFVTYSLLKILKKVLSFEVCRNRSAPFDADRKLMPGDKKSIFRKKITYALLAKHGRLPITI